MGRDIRGVHYHCLPAFVLAFSRYDGIKRPCVPCFLKFTVLLHSLWLCILLVTAYRFGK